MAGLVRVAAAVGLIAYFSPVREQSPEQRAEALRAAPVEAARQAAAHGPRLAADAVRALDPEARDRLANFIATMVVPAAPGG